MKQEQIHAAMVAAMKAKDKNRKNVLSFLLGAIKNLEIEKKRKLTDDEVNSVINKQIKQTQDVLDVIPKDREDLIKENEFTISVLKEYAPVMLNENEIRHHVYMVCAENNLDVNTLSKSDKGKLMGLLMPKVKGKADGKLVNKVVGEYCK